MLLYALDRLELDSFVGVLDSKLVVVFDLTLCLTQEVDRFAAQLRHSTVDGILVRIVAEDLNLHADVVLLVPIKPSRRILGQLLIAYLL